MKKRVGSQKKSSYEKKGGKTAILGLTANSAIPNDSAGNVGIPVTGQRSTIDGSDGGSTRSKTRARTVPGRQETDVAMDTMNAGDVKWSTVLSATGRRASDNQNRRGLYVD